MQGSFRNEDLLSLLNIRSRRVDCQIRVVDSGQKLRGIRHGSKRPDLVIVDDLENDESIASPEQKKKLKRWVSKTLKKIRQKNTV